MSIGEEGGDLTVWQKECLCEKAFKPGIRHLYIGGGGVHFREILKGLSVLEWVEVKGSGVEAALYTWSRQELLVGLCVM